MHTTHLKISQKTSSFSAGSFLLEYGEQEKKRRQIVEIEKIEFWKGALEKNK